MSDYRNLSITLLSGGVGGARLARGLPQVTDSATIIVNVGDDATIYGLHVSPDVDTVIYTLAGLEGPLGWGVADDTTAAMAELKRLGADTTFQLGDRDLATNLYRTARLRSGATLSQVTAELTSARGVPVRVLPVTDDSVATWVETAEAGWMPFQTYFVTRRHVDTVLDVEFRGADVATPAPGVVDAIRSADAVVIAPSNPVLSIQPMLAIPGVADALADRQRVIAVSPLFGGRALKGPTVEVLESLGHPSGNSGIAEVYRDVITDLIVDIDDADDVAPSLRTSSLPTRFDTEEASAAFWRLLLEEMA